MRVDENKVALFCAEAGNSVHKGSIVVPWEADGKEAGLEARSCSYPISNLIIGIDAVDWRKLLNVAVYTICDEHDCQFFQVRVILKKHLNPLKDTHEVRTAASSDAIDLAIVAVLWLIGTNGALSAIAISVELLKRTFLGVIVFFTDDLST